MNRDQQKAYYAKLPQHQKKKVDFHSKDNESRKGVPVELLNPALNKYNSVRYQALKNSENYISDKDIDWKCSYCGKIIHMNKIHFHGFDKPNRTGAIQKEFTAVNDSRAFGSKENAKHLLKYHMKEINESREREKAMREKQ
jgi:hypothetical protein